MPKVSDMVGDYADPLGNAGLNVDPDVAQGAADTIREIISRASQEAIEVNTVMDHDQLFAAWRLLNAAERAAFKALVSCGRRHAHQ